MSALIKKCTLLVLLVTVRYNFGSDFVKILVPKIEVVGSTPGPQNCQTWMSSAMHVCTSDQLWLWRTIPLQL